MERRIAPIQEVQSQTRELFIDGIKVTLRYGSNSNPDAVKKIKDILLTGGSSPRKN